MKTKKISFFMLPMLVGNLLFAQHHNDNLHKHFILLCGSFVFSTASLSSIATQTLFCTILSNIRIDFLVSLISWITKFQKWAATINLGVVFWKCVQWNIYLLFLENSINTLPWCYMQKKSKQYAFKYKFLKVEWQKIVA